MHRVKVDVVHFNRANTMAHELAKAIGALQLMLYGEITINQKVIEALRIIEKESIRDKHDFHKILTEANETGKSNRRVDLVDLSMGEEYEFETDHKRALRFDGKPINVIKLWRQT